MVQYRVGMAQEHIATKSPRSLTGSLIPWEGRTSPFRSSGVQHVLGNCLRHAVTMSALWRRGFNDGLVSAKRTQALIRIRTVEGDVAIFNGTSWRHASSRNLGVSLTRKSSPAQPNPMYMPPFSSVSQQGQCALLSLGYPFRAPEEGRSLSDQAKYVRGMAPDKQTHVANGGSRIEIRVLSCFCATRRSWEALFV